MKYSLKTFLVCPYYKSSTVAGRPRSGSAAGSSAGVSGSIESTAAADSSPNSASNPASISDVSVDLPVSAN